MAAVSRDLLPYFTSWRILLCCYSVGLFMHMSRSLLPNTMVWASANSPRRLSHSTPSVFRSYTEIDNTAPVGSIHSPTESNVEPTAGRNKRALATASEEQLPTSHRSRRGAATSILSGLRSVYNASSRPAVDSRNRAKDPDRFVMRRAVVHSIEEVTERSDHHDLRGEDSAQTDSVNAPDDELVSELLHLGEYPHHIESLSDPEAVKILAHLVATTNTHDIVSQSRKKKLVEAFNMYLPDGDRFFVESLSDASESKEFVRGPLLGVGGNGLVFEAQDSDGHVYALKLLLVRMSTFLEAVGDLSHDAWRREEDWAFARALRKEMKVLRLFPPDKSPEQLYEEGFVLPLFQGILAGKPRMTPLTEEFGATSVVVGFHKVACSVGQLFSAHRLPDGVKLELTKQMVDRVARLHSYGILHGDVKWENFFLDDNGRVFLGDFEQAQSLGHRRTGPCGPRGGGTPSLHEPARAACYFSEPDRRLDLLESRDSWCLGVVSYKLWCHRLPFGLHLNRADMEGFMNQVATIERDRLVPDFDDCRGSEQTPEDVKELIAALLYHDRYRRETPLSLIEKSHLFRRPPSERNDVSVELRAHESDAADVLRPAAPLPEERLHAPETKFFKPRKHWWRSYLQACSIQ
ncbi:rhoptry kinase family protein ROP32 [Toxoplasma gondii VEG]|uniref:Rhoptry kinase family protein ROP32 n=2 Tax=Toxoplasma gondii TaxID=5811 RepID=V4ZW43_TOXGV|nr:rhoptry kinase family protein ROP32 [Toxoplasma gondii VEG]KFG52079.1 rhoptry kinase family protein ROP32 [Toxoplasma gondii p89]